MKVSKCLILPFQIKMLKCFNFFSKDEFPSTIYFDLIKHKDRKQNENFIFGQIIYFLKQKLFGCFFGVLFNIISIIKELTSGHLRKNICQHLCLCNHNENSLYI